MKSRKKEKRRGGKRDIQFSFFDIVRARAHRRTILHASTLPSFARFTRVPLSAAENDVEETFVWQLARRRRRRDVFRIRKSVCLYSRTTTNPLLRLTKFRGILHFPLLEPTKNREVWLVITQLPWNHWKPIRFTTRRLLRTTLVRITFRKCTNV